MTSLPIPKIYWDALQSALQAEVKKLAKEVAASVKQPEQPLIKALQSEKVSAYLFEEEGQEFHDIQSMRCQHPTPSHENPSILEICNQPILIGKGNACPYHTYKKKQDISHLPLFRKMRIDNVLYLLDTANNIYSIEDFRICGFYRNNKCSLFIPVEST